MSLNTIEAWVNVYLCVFLRVHASCVPGRQTRTARWKRALQGRILHALCSEIRFGCGYAALCH
jgi:hypothetical protein